MSISNFIHEQAICESSNIGSDTRVWAFAHILAGAKVGSSCNICDHVFIENDVIIGDRTTVKCGVQLWDGVRLGNNVFIGPNVTFTNDLFPRSKKYPEKFLETIISDSASIGANATILPGVNIGEGAMIGAGSVVTSNIPAHAIVVGNPAKIVGFSEVKHQEFEIKKELAGVQKTSLANVGLHVSPEFIDNRGGLTFFEFGNEIPFEVKRSFIIYKVSEGKFRGNHAHRKSHQFIVCVHGSVKLVTDDGNQRQQHELASPSVGVHVGPQTWNILYDFKDEAVVVVYNSDKYDLQDYIDDYSELRELNKE